MSTNSKIEWTARAAELLRESAADLKLCHTVGVSDDWTGEEDAKAAHDEYLAVAAAIEAAPAAPAPAVADLSVLNDDLIDILGRPNFTCIRLAQALRLCGVEIKSKAEHEQAAVIHFLLTRYMRHGSDWAKHTDSDLRAMLDEVEAKNKAAMAPKADDTPPATGEGDDRG